MFLKILQISVESTCVADLRACNFIPKRLQQKCFPVKFLRTSFYTEQLRWLLFKIRNSNNLFIDVSVISLTHNQSLIIYNFSQSQTNLKIHSLTKSLFQYSIFVTDLEQPPFFLRSGLNNLTTLLFFTTSEKLRYLAKSSRICIFSISTFLALLNDQSFSSFHGKN